MYQAIHFDHFTKTCFLRDTNEGLQEFSYYPTAYRPDKNGEYITLDGKKVSAVTRFDRDDKSLYEKDVDMHLRILLDVYQDSDDIPEWHNRVFLDIETEIGGAINLAYCQQAPAKVTAIALYDENTQMYYAYVLDESKRIKDSLSRNGVEVIPCSNEGSLLRSFLDKWHELDPTICIHWNGDNFDIPYLYNRLIRILGQEMADSLSPVGIVKFDDYDQKMPYKIACVNCLDMMRLYKKFVPKQQPSYALDAICMKHLKRGKIKYEGSLDNLFKTDIEKYIEYNINDVKLMVDLEEELKFVALAVSVSHKGHVPYHYVYQSSKLLDGVIMTYLRRKGIVSPNKPTTNDPSLKGTLESEEDDKFAGAYVMDPIPGKYRWNSDLDLESLYPSNGIMLNTSPETVLFKVLTSDPFDDTWNLKDMREKDPKQSIQIETMEGRLKSITVGKLISFIEDNDITISPNGVGFDNGKLGILAEVMIDWFEQRKYFKNLMKDAGKKGDMKLYAFYDLTQQIYKVLLNSIYGVMGLKSFRYSDGKDFLASAITSVGRLVIQRSADHVNEMIASDCDIDINDLPNQIIMSDTDSLFFDCMTLLKSFEIDPENDEQVVPAIRKISKKYSDRMNTWYETFAKERFNCHKNRLKIKSETISKSLYVSAAKQYAQYIVEKEGVKMEGDKCWDLKGLDIIKSSFPKIFRDFCMDMIKDILLDKPKSHIDSSILSFRDKFRTMSMQEVAKPTGIGKLKEYLKHGPRAGGMFSSFLPKAPANTRAATYYNDLIKFRKQEGTHPMIQVGDKMKWLYLRSNPYNIDVLGFNETNPPQEIIQYIETYMDREAMFDKNLCKKIQKVYDNMGWGPINYNRNVSKYIKYLED